MDRSPITITALEEGDDRAITEHVAGPVALLVAKAHKLKDRLDNQEARSDRLTNKDAGDVYRIMMTTPLQW